LGYFTHFFKFNQWLVV